MIELRQSAVWRDGHVDGQVRDLREPAIDDGLLRSATARLGDAQTGPSLMASIEGRRYPRKTPAHLHKSDTFRMALGEPITVGPTQYTHGEFRLQQANTFYGPERWTDEVGTNQLLIMADRRGGKPWLTTAELQLLADLGGTPEEESARGYRQLPRDAEVDHVIVTNLGIAPQAGSLDGGFTSAGTWPALPDGTTLAVIAIGDRRHGPLLLLWNRPARATALPEMSMPTDLLRLTVAGGHRLGDRNCKRLAFRLVEAGAVEPPSHVGKAGCQELWFLAHRAGAEALVRSLGDIGPAAAGEVVRVLTGAVDPSATAAPSPPSRSAHLARTATIGGAGTIELHHRQSDDAVDSHYVVAVNGSTGQTVAFSDSAEDARDLLPLVEALRAGGTGVRTLHDTANDVWLFRIVDAMGRQLLQSVPWADESAMRAAIRQIEEAAPSATLIGDVAASA